MPEISYEIEKIQLENNRANEVPIKVIITNSTSNKILLATLVPNIQSTVDLEEKIDVFQEDSKAKFEELCQELSFIVDGIFIESSKEHRINLVNTLTQVYKEVYSNLPKMLRMMIFDESTFKRRIKMFNVKLSKLRYKISDLNDANWAYEKWVNILPDENPEKKLYEGKLEQLKKLLKQIGEIETKYLATIEPGSFYSRTYVLTFNRNSLSTKVYPISFDSTYVDENSKQEYRANVSSSIVISPKPLALSLFAALAGIFGVSLKFCMTHINDVVKPIEFFNYLGNSLVTAPGIAAVITSILVFNIYEFTDLGKKINTGVNWRTALTIGIFSGLLSERIVDAMKILIGFK